MIENKGFIKIKEKLLKDAEEKANEIVKKAEEEAFLYEQEKKKEVDEYIKAQEEKIEIERQLLRDRMLAQARLEAKTEYLNVREQLIDGIIAKATSQIKRDASYQKFVRKVLSESKSELKQPIKVLVNKQDVELTKKLLASLKVKGQVSAAGLTAGIIVEGSDGKRVDESFESRLQRMKDDIRIRVAKLLESS